MQTRSDLGGQRFGDRLALQLHLSVGALVVEQNEGGIRSPGKRHLVIVLVFTALYAHYAINPVVSGALRGMGAVSAGLIVGTGLKLVGAVRSNPMQAPVCSALLVLAFAAVALLRWPLVWVILALGLAACAYAWARLRPDIAKPGRP